jgi:hypothetical protein
VNIEFHGWHFKVELEKTRSAYLATGNRGAEDCTCYSCRNLVAQRALEYPLELRTFLESVGADPFKESNLWVWIPDGSGTYGFYNGMWYFIGEVTVVGESLIKLRANPSGYGKDWFLEFSPNSSNVGIDTLPMSPLVQVELSAKLPWVLDEEQPV